MPAVSTWYRVGRLDMSMLVVGSRKPIDCCLLYPTNVVQCRVIVWVSWRGDVGDVGDTCTCRKETSGRRGRRGRITSLPLTGPTRPRCSHLPAL